MPFITDLLSKVTNLRIKIGDKLNILKREIGQLNSLTTNDKTSLVGAINEVNNIQIGGRNLILNSKSLEGRTDSYGGLTTAVMPLSIKLEKDKEYIFIYKNNNDIPRAEINTITLRNENGETIQDIQTIGDGSPTIFKPNVDGVIGIAFYSVWKNAFFSFRELMLTSGNKIVDWTPAIEDQVSDWNETDSTKHSFIKNKPTIPTVNNGQIALSTGTGLSGSANFTANQAGGSTFSVAVANTHKLPTITEWNALSTQTLSNSTSNLVVSNTVQRAALTGDVTAAQNSNDTTIANSAVTHAKYQNIATQRILGRGATGTGNVQELTLGANLTLSTAGVLSATDTNTTYIAGNGLSLSGTTFGQTLTTSGTGTFVTGVTQTTNGFQINLGTPPNTDTTYTGSNGINVAGTVISPTYGTAAGTIAQGNDARINNGQTAFNSLGNYVLRTNLNNRLGLLSSVTGGSDFYYSPSTDPDKPIGVDDGAFMSMSYDSNNWYSQLYNDWRNNEWYVRSKHSGTWNSFQKLIHTGNISSELSGYVPTSRTITINGLTQNLSANRTWTVPDTVTSLRGTESGIYTSGDITLLAGANTTITQSGANITIASTDTITAQAFYESSLRKYKTNIKPYEESALEVIKNIEIVTFDRTDSDVKNKIGIIADDSPSEILNEEHDAVDLYKTIFVLTKAVQELNAKIKELEKQK